MVEVGGAERIKKCVLRACLYASRKYLANRTRQKRHDCEKNEQNSPRARFAGTTELTHTWLTVSVRKCPVEVKVPGLGLTDLTHKGFRFKK